jgi:hypothetical protein
VQPSTNSPCGRSPVVPESENESARTVRRRVKLLHGPSKPISVMLSPKFRMMQSSMVQSAAPAQEREPGDPADGAGRVGRHHFQLADQDIRDAEGRPAAARALERLAAAVGRDVVIDQGSRAGISPVRAIPVGLEDERMGPILALTFELEPVRERIAPQQPDGRSVHVVATQKQRVVGLADRCDTGCRATHPRWCHCRAMTRRTGPMPPVPRGRD